MVSLTQVKRSTLALLDEPVHVSRHTPSLGMSEIGHSCTRYLWFKFRWAYTGSFPSRMIRLFNRGHREEDVVIKLLTDIGYEVSGAQNKVITGFGHVKGFCDGEVKGVIEAPKTTHILEIKAVNDRAFKEFLKKGTKVARPQYFAQCQLYMHHFGRTRTLFVVVNKNDDSIYIERIKYDKNVAFTLNRRAEGIILADSPPPKAYSATWFVCKYCDARHICHEGIHWNENCRTCSFVEPSPGGNWHCNVSGEIIDYSQQLKGCDKYETI